MPHERKVRSAFSTAITPRLTFFSASRTDRSATEPFSASPLSAVERDLVEQQPGLRINQLALLLAQVLAPHDRQSLPFVHAIGEAQLAFGRGGRSAYPAI